MGYFSNGSEGEGYQGKYCFNCANWKYDKETDTYGCPIWDLHFLYSYELCNSKSLAKEMLETYIPSGEGEGGSNGECTMFLPMVILPLNKCEQS